jgi:hypothetical protein
VVERVHGVWIGHACVFFVVEVIEPLGEDRCGAVYEEEL